MSNYFNSIPQEPEKYIKVDTSDLTTIPKFDPMPKPKVVNPDNECDPELFYNIKIREEQHRFHKYYPLTTLFGYNGSG
jgi:spore coat protein A